MSVSAYKVTGKELHSAEYMLVAGAVAMPEYHLTT